MTTPDFTLQLSGDDQTGFTVSLLGTNSANAGTRVISGPHQIQVPKRQAVEEDIKILEQEIKESGYEEDLGPEAMHRLGQQFFEMLFPKRISDQFKDYLQRAVKNERFARIRLLVEPLFLANWPLEYLYHDQFGYIALHPNISIVRDGYLKPEHSLPPLSVDTLRILIVACNLVDNEEWPQLDVIQEGKLIEQLVGSSSELSALKPLLFAERCDNPTRSEFLDKIENGNYHILVYLGHAYYKRPNDKLPEYLTAGLVLDDGFNRPDFVESSQIANLLNPSNTSLRLVILNACETMRQDSFQGIAQSLAQKGLSTIGMRFEQPDSSGLIGHLSFWQQMIQHRPVDHCLSFARRTVAEAIGIGRPDWGNAILIMPSHDGKLTRPVDPTRRYLDTLRDRYALPRSGIQSDRVRLQLGDDVVDLTKIIESPGILKIHSPLSMKESLSLLLGIWLKDNVSMARRLPLVIHVEKWADYEDIYAYLKKQDYGFPPESAPGKDFAAKVETEIVAKNAVIFFVINEEGKVDSDSVLSDKIDQAVTGSLKNIPIFFVFCNGITDSESWTFLHEHELAVILSIQESILQILQEIAQGQVEAAKELARNWKGVGAGFVEPCLTGLAALKQGDWHAAVGAFETATGFLDEQGASRPPQLDAWFQRAKAGETAVARFEAKPPRFSFKLAYYSEILERYDFASTGTPKSKRGRLFRLLRQLWHGFDP